MGSREVPCSPPGGGRLARVGTPTRKAEGGHRDTHLWETSRQARRIREVYDWLTRIAKEANSGRGDAECVSVPEEPYEGNLHVRFYERGAGCMTCIPLLDPQSEVFQCYKKLP